MRWPHKTLTVVLTLHLSLSCTDSTRDNIFTRAALILSRLHRRRMHSCTETLLGALSRVASRRLSCSQLLMLGLHTAARGRTIHIRAAMSSGIVLTAGARTPGRARIGQKANDGSHAARACCVALQ